MITKLEIQEARRRWDEHCRYIQTMTVISDKVSAESGNDKQRRVTALLDNYPAFCEYYFPHYLQLRDKTTGQVIKVVHNAPFHNKAAEKVRNTPNLKAVFKWPRGHAKTTHLGIFTPLWLCLRPSRLLNFMLVVGKSEDSAVTFLSDIQSELEYNQRILDDFGPQKNMGSWEEGEFITQSGVAFFARGRGQSPRGLRYREARPDYILIDDLDDDELCRNEARVTQLTDWVKEALFGTLDAGRGRFVMIGNLISKNSVLANIAATKGVFVSEIQAEDKNGDPVWKDKWTRDEMESAREFMGYRAWQKEMMHNPITQGAIFKQEWIRYKKIFPLHKYDSIVAYVDPSFKSTKKNDFKAVRVWGKHKRELHLLYTYVRQDTVSGMVRWMYNLHESLPENVVISYFMEANFMQDIILDEFAAEGDARGYQLPVMPDKRKKPDKLQRCESISPLWERGFVFYNEALKNDPDMIAGIEQTLALERGSSSHDDAPDADEGAIWILQKSTREAMYQPTFGRRPSAKNIW